MVSAAIPWLGEEACVRASDVRALAVEMSDAYASGGRSEADVPPRTVLVRDTPFAAFVAMPALSSHCGLFIVKAGAIVEKVPPEPTVQAAVVAFSSRTGRPLAFVDGNAVTNLKCAAVSAMVTERCARTDAHVLAVIGSGVQAREQIRGVAAVRALTEIRVWSRDLARVADFLRANESLVPAARLVPCASAAEAVDGADVVSTATTSARPVVEAEMLCRGGLHVNAMGAHTLSSREVPAAVLESSIVIVEDVPLAVAEAGLVHRHAIALADLVHRDPAEIRRQRTVFSSTGHAFLDLLACRHLLARSAVPLE